MNRAGGIRQPVRLTHVKADKTNRMEEELQKHTVDQLGGAVSGLIVGVAAHFLMELPETLVFIIPLSLVVGVNISLLLHGAENRVAKYFHVIIIALVLLLLDAALFTAI